MNLVWIYNSISGSVGEVPSVMASALLAVSAAGWHGPFATKQDALNYYSANAAAHPNWAAPAGIAGNVVNSATNIGVAAGQAATGGGVVGQVAQLIAPVAEIAVGLVLLAIAANAILKQTTGVDAAGTARRTAVKAGKTAATAAAVA